MRRATPALISMLWLASAATPAVAQFTENRSILSALEPQQTLSVGDEVEGRLTADDYEYSGEVVKAYAFEGAQGAPVTIDVMSDTFDSYAYLLGPDGVMIDQDDDSGGLCHARISTFLPATGRYTIVAASLSGDTGAFTVRLADRESPAATGACGGGEIQDDLLELLNDVETGGTVSVGDEVSDELVEGDPRLADGSFMKAYELVGTPGEIVVVDVASRAFDALVLVVDPRGESYTTDDDSGGACNARIEVTLDMQPHKVVVTSFVSDGAGYYTLSVREEWGDQHIGSCPGIAQTP
ncbi:MAG: hypothetical protein R3195_16685 [Gemmatimonadota bacterium]|nr:hypothetical protein [Gemmatimonadota bacterium]